MSIKAINPSGESGDFVIEGSWPPLGYLGRSAIGASAMSTHTFHLRNEVPSTAVHQIDSDYDGRNIKMTVEILVPGTYVVAGGQVGQKEPSGHDTFTSHSVVSTKITGAKGDRRTIRLRTTISRGYWAVGVFRSTDEIVTTSCAKEAPVVSATTLFWLLIAASFVGLALFGQSGSNSDTSTPRYEATEDKLRRVYDSQGIRHDDRMIREDARAIEQLHREVGK